VFAERIVVVVMVVDDDIDDVSDDVDIDDIDDVLHDDIVALHRYAEELAREDHTTSSVTWVEP